MNKRNNSPKVIYENSNFFVLDKPSGMDVEELQSWVKNNLKSQISASYELRSGIVHRLDKDTSGVILVAKDTQTFFSLQKQFAERLVKKTYIALVHGKVDPAKGSIEAPIARNPVRRTRFGVFEGGRPAATDYKVIKYYKYENKNPEDLTLLELCPKTGRTHQLRVHLKHINHPIVSDPLYAGRKISRHDRVWCSRLFLHASKIVFTNPKTQKIETITSEIPPDLKSTLNLLRV